MANPFIGGGKTASPSYAVNVQGGKSYDLTPLLTVGEEVPLLEGEFGGYDTSESLTYAFAGIPDGIGHSEIDGLNYVWVNHEFSANVTTDISSTIEGQINGTRVSLFVFDEDWNVIGGKNLIETVEADGQTYALDLETGNYLDLDGNLLNEYAYAGYGNLSRFCSGYLAAKGFVDDNGEAIPVWFAPEESGSASRGWAVTPDGTATAIDGLGRYSLEQVYAASQYRTGNDSGKTVIFGTEDTSNGELYMYVGEQTEEDPNGFSDITGSLYVLRLEDAEGNAYTYETMPENVDIVGKWVAVPDHVTLSEDGSVLSNWVDTKFNTLNGQAPIVVGHRGASGTLPEHTLEAYALAIEQGADFVEPDLVITNDGVLIARHEPLLDDTTNVAEVFGEERKSTKMVDGTEITGFFAEDFTLAEIKQLRAVQSRDYRPDTFDGQFEIPTLEEIIDLVKGVEAETGKQIGIYPETKHPTFFDEQGLSLEEPLVQTLIDNDFTDPSRIFIQSFELQNLIELKEAVKGTDLEEVPLVQLFGNFEGEGGFSTPYDIIHNVAAGNDLDAIYKTTDSDGNEVKLSDLIDISSVQNYGDFATPDVLNWIGEYASGLGPWKNTFLKREALEPENYVDANGDGVAEIRSQLTGEILPLVDWAHDAGMQVHPYTLRDEERFLTLNIDGTPQSAEEEFRQLIELGVDGFFTDFPETGDQVRDEMVQEYADSVRSTNFRRLEDIHEDPNNPGTFYFVTTGRNDFGVDTDGDGVLDAPDNSFGKLHRFTLNPNNPTGDVKFEFLMEGGENTGVSFDNMTVDSQGNVLIQEDKTAGGGAVLAAQERQATVLSYNIAENEGKVGNDEVEFLFELNQGELDPSQAENYGDWESSGIVEINESGNYLFDVQAHSIRDGVDAEGNPVGLSDDGEGDIQFYEGRYGQGGQLLLATDNSQSTPFDTEEQAQLKGLSGYTVDPIFTVGETVNDYTPPGILDGLGAFALDEDTVRVLANHELRANLGYAYELANGTSLTGARVSYFDINKETRELEDVGLAYDTIINRQGEVVDEASDLESGGLNRLCSAQYMEAQQFGEGRGLEDGMFFTGEETYGGTEFVVDSATNTMYAVPWMGRAGWESVTELDTGDTEKVAILIGDDREAAPLLMYVGTKDRSEGAGFLERNGLVDGKVYAWVADSGETSPEEFKGTFESRDGKWVEIDIYDETQKGTAVDSDDEDSSIQNELGYDADGFATQAQQDALAEAAGAFTFSRPEDVATNPEDGTVAVMASTGRGGRFPSDDWGTTYKIDVDFTNLTAKLDILYDGDDAGAGQFAGPDFGLRSPDNLEWADDGYIYLQEDRSTGNFGQTSGEEASIWKLDPNTGKLTRVGQVDRNAVPAGQTDSDPDDIGDWETSGITDVSSLFGEDPGNLFIFDVQAHSLRDGVIAEEGLVQGGQLAFLENNLETVTKLDADNTFDTSSPAQMEGLNGYVVDPVFTVGESFDTGTQVYTPPGILDGLGAFALDEDTVRVLANHELRANVGYAYQLENGTFLTGARVSYFDINKETRELEGTGLAYDTIYNRAGEVVDEASDLEFGGLNRLCSAQYIGMHQFGDGRGLEDGLFFTGEETGGGTEFVLDPETNTLHAVPWMGRAAWESVTELDTGDTETVAILVGDDRGGAPLLLYVGTKDRSADANVLERNGLANGKLYVWAENNGETTPAEFKGTGENRDGKFVEIDIYDATLAGTEGYDELGFVTQEKQDELAKAAGAFKFSRPEDLATSPTDGTKAVLASTGRSSLFPEDSWGTTYIIDADFSDLANGNISANVNAIYDGDDAGAGQFEGPDYGLRSPDNLEWAKDGTIYLQEDRSFGEFGQTSGEEASIWALDPESGKLTRVSQINRDAVPEGQTDGDPDDIGDWETSGIIDVSNLFGEDPGELFLFDVQAHSLRDGVIEDANLVQGGQLAFLSNPVKDAIELSPEKTFDTSSAAQMKGVEGSGYSVDPVFTVGESFNTGDQTYTPPGILDGLGAFALDEDTVRVLANHELRANVGYAYQLENGTFLTGARVSYFDINKETRELEDVGLAYDTIINRQGEVVDEASDLEFGGLNRLCSAQYINMHQFGDGRGLEDGMFFTGEESYGGTEFVVDTATDTMYAVPWMGRAGWESVTEIDTGNTENVAILIGDDRAGAPLLMYVGTKDRSEGAGFLERNGLVNGKVYAWKADSGETSPEQFKGTFASREGSWVEIKVYDETKKGTAVDTDGDGSIQDELGYDADGFATQKQQDELAQDAGAFTFSRPEDLATSPTDGTLAVMASTGRGSRFPSDDWGTTYKIDVDFNNIETGDITAKLDILYDGDDAGAGQFAGPDYGLRSPDNLEWAKDGYIYLQEDRSTSNFGQTSGEEASIWRLDPNSGELTRVSQVDRTAVPDGQTDSDPTDIGDWETSGIIDVSNLFGEDPGELFLFDVQAHSLRDGAIADSDLVQGGQLAFLSVDTPIEPITEKPVEEIISELNQAKITETTDATDGTTIVETIDLSNFTEGVQVTAEYIISREADFNNEVYFYAVDDANGTVDNLAPTADGYLQAALSRIVHAEKAFATNDDALETGTITFEAGSVLAPMIIANASLEQALNGEATVHLGFAGVAGNDGFDHVKKLNDNTFGFEDLPGGGDQDFDDIKIAFTEFSV